MSTTQAQPAIQNVPARQPALVLTDVCKSYGDGDSTVIALDHVDLTVAKGELVAIVGPSGSGKSSLLAIAGALTRPDSGEVIVGGEALAGLKDGQLTRVRRDHIGFVFQSGNLPTALTSRQQLVLAAKIRGRQGRLDPAGLLAAVGMTHREGSRPSGLSGGERQRVGIARALVGDPDLLLVDEPTAALDRVKSQEIVQLLAHETHTHGVGTVLVTHDHDILHHCDRVYEMVDGRLSPAN